MCSQLGSILVLESEFARIAAVWACHRRDGVSSQLITTLYSSTKFLERSFSPNAQSQMCNAEVSRVSGTWFRLGNPPKQSTYSIFGASF